MGLPPDPTWTICMAVGMGFRAACRDDAREALLPQLSSPLATIGLTDIRCCPPLGWAASAGAL